MLASENGKFLQISFGLVSVPVRLFTAVESHTIRFHQVQRGTGDRVRQKRVNERTGEEVPFTDVVKGYPTEADWVIVEPKELEDIAPGRSRSLEIIGFVDLDQRNGCGHSSTQSELTRRSRKPSQHRDPLRRRPHGHAASQRRARSGHQRTP
ncbi:Ku protein [Saccharopolyspora shandongensis]|uniref:Ku protein n=1 Tax=Saccharopolyspora shandongensis TaxID=418495 RepID=UPI003421817D